MVAAVARAAEATPLVAGKPQAPLYLLCAERVAQPPSSVLAIGDRLDTDIAGAVAAGMDSALVLTGVDSVETLAVARPGQRPTFLLEDLRGVHEPYAAPVLDGEWWVCGGDRRRLVQGRWQVARLGSAVEAKRATVAAVHHALDSGRAQEGDVAALLTGFGLGQ
jgi:hypothetical protein